MRAEDIAGKIGLKSLVDKIRLFLARDFFRNRIVFWLLLLNLILNGASWVILAIFIQPIDLNIILHYNVYFGVDLMGSFRQVFFLPLVGLILWIINSFLAHYFYSQYERVASYILLTGAFMAQLCILVACASVIRINY